MNLFSSKELIIMASILGVILFLIIVISILEMLDNRKSKKREVPEEKEEIIKEEPKKVIVKEEVKEEKKAEIEEIEVLDFDDEVIVKKEDLPVAINVEPSEEYDTFVPNEVIEPIREEKKEAILELQKLEAELESPEEINLEDTVTNFELEQERTAIISYDELVKLGDTLYTTNEITQYDDGDEPITIDEVIKKFANNDMVFENTANYEKLDKSMDKETKLIESYKNE